MLFLYGIEGKYIDVTYIVLTKCKDNDNIVIPATDVERARLFGDPAFMSLKHLLVYDNEGNKNYFLNGEAVNISTTINFTQHSGTPSLKNWWDTEGKNIVDSEERLKALQARIRLLNGTVYDEIPEQLLAVQFLNPAAKVLELGANIGRNTIVMSTILNDSYNLVTLECDPKTAAELQKNLDINGSRARIETAALSKKKLIQQGWNTVPLVGDAIPSGWTPVKTVTFDQIVAKYGDDFDTLVADCEGALYYIFQDEPEMLNSIKTIIMENDYTDITHKRAVDEFIVKRGFKRVHHVAGGWGPCYNYFYEVWQK